MENEAFKPNEEDQKFIEGKILDIIKYHNLNPSRELYSTILSALSCALCSFYQQGNIDHADTKEYILESISYFYDKVLELNKDKRHDK